MARAPQLQPATCAARISADDTAFDNCPRHRPYRHPQRTDARRLYGTHARGDVEGPGARASFVLGAGPCLCRRGRGSGQARHAIGGQPGDRDRLQRHAVGASAVRAVSGPDPRRRARGRRNGTGRGRRAGDVRRGDPGRSGDGAEPLLPRRDRAGGRGGAQPQHLRRRRVSGGLRQDRAGSGDRRAGLRAPSGGLRAGWADDQRARQRGEIQGAPEVRCRRGRA